MAKALAVAENGDVTEEACPAWRLAVRAFMKLRPKPNMIVKREWLEDQFGIERPKDGSLKRYNEYSFAWLSSFNRFQRELLEQFCIDLRWVKDQGGYEVIPPWDQSSEAWRDGQKEISRAVDRMHRRVLYVDHAKLNSAQRKQNLHMLHSVHLQKTAIRRERNTSAMIGRKLRIEALKGE